MPFLLPLISLARLYSIWALTFLVLSRYTLDCVSIFLLGYLFQILPLICFFSTLFFWSSLFVQIPSPPVHRDGLFLNFEEVILKNQPALLEPFSLQVHNL